MTTVDFSTTISDNKITLVGENKFKMTDFNIDPPKALFGTITTGDDINIKFSNFIKKYKLDSFEIIYKNNRNIKHSLAYI